MKETYGFVDEVSGRSRAAIDETLARVSTWDSAMARLRSQLLRLYPRSGEVPEERLRDLRARRPSALELLSQRTQDALDGVLHARDKLFGRAGVVETLSELEQLPVAAEAIGEIQRLRDAIEADCRPAIDGAVGRLTEIGQAIEKCLAKL